MSGIPRVYVGNLPRDTRERDIERFFKGYGYVRDVTMKNGFCFVEFDDRNDAEDAIHDLNGKDLLGSRAIVEFSRGSARGPGGVRIDERGGGGGGGRYGGGRDGRDSRDGRDDRYGSRDPGGRSRFGPPTRTPYRVIVENLSSRVSWQDLKDYMRSAGEVTYAEAHNRGDSEGIVEFASRSDMKSAIRKLDKTELSGRKIRVFEDRPSHSPSRSRSRSRSRSPRRPTRRSRSRSPRYSRSRSPSRSGSDRE
ncbi:serine-arginine protein 55-like [Sycon ciliatum]|uniref:serine-arginine protein 55-like n=1 Tax=Sycon ciliatum TaxID=27933 RepID=UPI0031F68CE2